MGGRGRSVINVGRLSPTSITTQGPSGRRKLQGLIQRGAKRGARGEARLPFPVPYGPHHPPGPGSSPPPSTGIPSASRDLIRRLHLGSE